MGRLAEHVYTEPSQIRHLEHLVEQLPDSSHVMLLLHDGTSCDGIVCAQPSVQVFRDRNENEAADETHRNTTPDEKAQPRAHRSSTHAKVARASAEKQAAAPKAAAAPAAPAKPAKAASRGKAGKAGGWADPFEN